MTAKAACLRIKVAQLEVFRLENYRNIATLGSVLHSFEAEKQGDFFPFKLTGRFESDARGDRKLFGFFWPKIGDCVRKNIRHDKIEECQFRFMHSDV